VRLQVLYVQQGAVFWLCKSLGYPAAIASKPTPDKWIHAPGSEPLSEVRNLRHSAVGHAVNRDKGLAVDRGSYLIVRMSLSVRGFPMNFADDAATAVDRRARVRVGAHAAHAARNHASIDAR
jgi:hypothetical protein